jgi:phosphatidate cytidylyltransferase
VYCLAHVPALLALDISGFDGRQLLLIVFVVIVGQGANQVRSEVAQRRNNAHSRHLSTDLRPSAAEWGMAVMAGSVLGLFLCPITPFPAAVAVGLGAVVAAMGVAGRLVLSAIKRDRGVADWNQRDTETGGLLDRLDTLIFAAPVFFHLTRFLFAA